MSKKADLFDPLTFNGDSYVENNNPLAFVDPSGLQVSSGGGQPRTPEHPDPRIGFTFTISFGSFGSRGPNPFLFYGTGPLPQGPPDVDAADVGFWEGVIPVWGSGRQAIVDSNRGCVSGVVVNTALAASDVYLVRSAYKGATKGAWKMSGSLSWKGGSGVRAWYGATRELSFGQHVHHWLIPQGGW